MAMASGEQLKNAKIAVLDLINQNKDILFGKLSESLTREAKESKWAEVADHAHAVGAFPWHRTWEYLRDTTWQNWRKRFVEKREKREKHDNTGQGPKIVFDEADLLIMEILDALGKIVPSTSMQNNSFSTLNSKPEAAISDIHELLEIEMDVKQECTDETDGAHPYSNDNSLVNLNDEDTPGNDFHSGDERYINTQQDDLYDDEHTVYSQNSTRYATPSSAAIKKDKELPQPKIISTSSLSSPLSRASMLRKSAIASVRSTPSRKRPSSLMTHTSGDSAERELTALKCRKIRAELELLQREAYKKDLEILQLERALELPASDLTRKFYRSTSTNYNNCSIKNKFQNRFK